MNETERERIVGRFIPSDSNSLLEALSTAFSEAAESAAEVASLRDALKTKRQEIPPAHETTDARLREKRVKEMVPTVQSLTAANRNLHVKLQVLHAAHEALRAADAESPIHVSGFPGSQLSERWGRFTNTAVGVDQWRRISEKNAELLDQCYRAFRDDLVENNLACASELEDAAAALHFAVELMDLVFERTAREIEDQRGKAREYVVAYSGHGSEFRYDGADPDNPQPAPYMTYYEAITAACQWIAIADTIGGAAQIKNMRTGEIEDCQRSWWQYFDHDRHQEKPAKKSGKRGAK